MVKKAKKAKAIRRSLKHDVAERPLLRLPKLSAERRRRASGFLLGLPPSDRDYLRVGSKHKKDKKTRPNWKQRAMVAEGLIRTAESNAAIAEKNSAMLKSRMTEMSEQRAELLGWLVRVGTVAQRLAMNAEELREAVSTIPGYNGFDGSVR